MSRRWGWAFLALALLVIGILAGWSMEWNGIIGGNQDDEQKPLLKVEIHFSDGSMLVGYVKELGVSKEGTIYVGGSSTNYLYDAGGHVIGVFNYSHVSYMKVIK